MCIILIVLFTHYMLCKAAKGVVEEGEDPTIFELKKIQKVQV